eukprot:3627-Chlamydomonas_euryale.AAC.1
MHEVECCQRAGLQHDCLGSSLETDVCVMNARRGRHGTTGIQLASNESLPSRVGHSPLCPCVLLAPLPPPCPRPPLPPPLVSRLRPSLPPPGPPRLTWHAVTGCSVRVGGRNGHDLPQQNTPIPTTHARGTLFKLLL